MIGIFLSHFRQEAILAAISEKDAHIALLEMAPNAKTENIEEVEKLTKDKITLQSQLKELVRQQLFIRRVPNYMHMNDTGHCSTLTYFCVCAIY